MVLRSRRMIGWLGVFLWLLVVILGLKWGSVPGADSDLVYQLRLPRVILASAVGMGLAVSGAVLQALFSNPLCEPYTLGISSGAALGAVIGATFHWEGQFFGLALSSFAGAGLVGLLLVAISHYSRVDNLALLLAGVLMSFVGNSLVALWMAVADSSGIQGVIRWLFGDLSRARLLGASLSYVSCLSGVGVLWMQWRKLDALLLGEEGASSMGLDLRATRRDLILVSSLLVGTCVSSAGIIGFVGLIVPHFLRRVRGPLHFGLIPLCAIWGSLSLVLADLLARTVVRPFELPVGVLTALIGSPLFLLILLKRPRSGLGSRV